MSVIKYVGPFDEVSVPTAGVTCKRLETIEVEPHVAAELRGQADWEQPSSKSPAAKSATKNPQPEVDPAIVADEDPEAVEDTSGEQPTTEPVEPTETPGTES